MKAKIRRPIVKKILNNSQLLEKLFYLIETRDTNIKKTLQNTAFFVKHSHESS